MIEEKKLEDFLPNKNGSYYKKFEFQNEVNVIRKEQIIECIKNLEEILWRPLDDLQNDKGFKDWCFGRYVSTIAKALRFSLISRLKDLSEDIQVLSSKAILALEEQNRIRNQYVSKIADLDKGALKKLAAELEDVAQSEDISVYLKGQDGA